MDKERLKELLRNRGLKMTAQRRLVLETVASHPGEHLTAEEIYGLVKNQYPDIGLATVYRAVQVLVDLQVIDKVSFDDGLARYELSYQADGRRHHHHHAICQNCGRVLSFEEDLLEALEQAVFAATGFRVTDHEVKLYGYCKTCSNETKKSETEEIN